MATPSVLVIQFRRSEGAILGEQLGIKRASGEAASFSFVSALDPDVVEWERPETFMAGFSGLILGGSGDFDFDGGRAHDDESRKQSYVFLERLRPLFSYIFKHDLPTFGICYGHQLLGAFAGVSVHKDERQAKLGSHEVRVVEGQETAPILFGLPEVFLGHYGHKDVLSALPAGATLLLEGGEGCRVSGVRYQKNIYSVQFHPELTAADMIGRINNSPGYLPEGILAEDLFISDDKSQQLLANFIERVVNQSD